MRIVPRHILYEQKLAALARVIEIVESVGEREALQPINAGRSRNTAADVRVLRMIPVVAEGVAGRVPGTNPLDEVLAAEARRSRHSVR